MNTINNMNWLGTLKVGDKVFWNDPEDSLSGVKTITQIRNDSGTITDDLVEVELDGDTTAIPQELSPCQTGRIRVVLESEIAGPWGCLETLVEHQDTRLRSVIGDGLITADTEAVCLSWDLNVQPITATNTRDQLLARAEAFIAGFEGDEEQEGVDLLLADLRAAQVKEVRPATPVEQDLLDLATRTTQALNNKALSIKDRAEIGEASAIELAHFEETINQRRMSADLARFLKEGLELAAALFRNWESGDLAGSVQEMLDWQDRAAYQPRDCLFREELLEGIDRVAALRGAWESGNLADVVNELKQWFTETTTLLSEQSNVLMPIVVVEMKGGVIQDVSTLGQVEVFSMDYDDGEDDPGEYPAIPERGGAEAPIHQRGSGDPSFCLQVSLLEEVEPDESRVNTFDHWQMAVKAPFGLGSTNPVVFKTTLSEKHPSNEVYHRMSGKTANVTGVIVSAIGVQYDEEALPAFVLKFEDGTELTAFDGELEPVDQNTRRVIDRICYSFGVSRLAGYQGVGDLFERGTVQERAQLMSMSQD